VIDLSLYKGSEEVGGPLSTHLKTETYQVFEKVCFHLEFRQMAKLHEPEPSDYENVTHYHKNPLDSMKDCVHGSVTGIHLAIFKGAGVRD
jgi:hypothetical protein